MFTFIKDKIAQILDDIQRKREEMETGRRIKQFFKVLVLCVCVFCVGYGIGAHRKLIRALIRGD